MPGPATVLREIHRLRRHAKELQDRIEQGPRMLKHQQAKAARQRQKRRAGLRASLKRRATGWLRRVGLLGQERVT